MLTRLGLSLMPQKKNPDLSRELLRGKSGRVFRLFGWFFIDVPFEVNSVDLQQGQYEDKGTAFLTNTHGSLLVPPPPPPS